jgi:C-terminal processing protease CtpA/Prc
VGDAGTLGARVLTRFRVTFDYAHRRLVLEPDIDVARRETWEAAGFLLVQVPGEQLMVAMVMPATPADSAGIQAGDALRTVDGADAATMGLDSLRRHFRQPGRTDTLAFARGGAERIVMLHQGELP